MKIRPLILFLSPPVCSCGMIADPFGKPIDYFDSLLGSPSVAKEAGVQTSGGYIARVFLSVATGFYKVTSMGIANLAIPTEAIEAVAMMET